MSVFFTSFSYPESPGLFGGAKIEENGDLKEGLLTTTHESKSGILFIFRVGNTGWAWRLYVHHSLRFWRR